MQWAFWLRYFTGYDGYDEAIYEGFDELEDYSDILGTLKNTELAFGSYTGPSKEYFTGSILDPEEEKVQHTAGA